MFTRIAHICLHVRDLRRSIAYYEKLGLSVKFRFSRQGSPFGAYLEIGPGSYIELFEQPDVEQVENRSIAHFCLESEDIEASIAMLRAAGIAFTEKKLGCDETYQILALGPRWQPVRGPPVHAGKPAAPRWHGGGGLVAGKRRGRGGDGRLALRSGHAAQGGREAARSRR